MDCSGEVDMSKEWFSHQAYFTRARRLKFTSEYGYGIVDASPWFDIALADKYIKPIGQYIQFSYENTKKSIDNKQKNEFAYIILPSSDGCLSISYAFDTNDSERFTPFVHTYLLDQENARVCLRENMFTADAARVIFFNSEYVGVPAIEGTATTLSKVSSREIVGGVLPEDICIADSGFTPEKMFCLLHAIICAVENKHSDIKRVIVTYKYERDAFLTISRNLITLIYSCLPYSITSKLGVIIKTDNEWRNDLPHAYAITYVKNDLDYEDNRLNIKYMPGVELFILNQSIVRQGSTQVFSVSKDLIISVSPDVQICFDDTTLLNDMVCILDEKNTTDNELHSFYSFVHNISDGVLDFCDLSELYSLFTNLLQPEHLYDLNFSKLNEQIILSTTCLKKSHFIASDIKNRLQKFINIVYNRIAEISNSSGLSEESLVNILELTVSIDNLCGYETVKKCYMSYYELLLNLKFPTSTSKILNKALIMNPLFLKELFLIDKHEVIFAGMKNYFINECSLEIIENLVDCFDIINSKCPSKLYAIISNLFYSYGKDTLIASSLVKNAMGSSIQNIVKLLELNNVDVQQFSTNLSSINKIIEDYKDISDGWNARISLWRLKDKLNSTSVQNKYLLKYASGCEAVARKGKIEDMAAINASIKSWFCDKDTSISLLLFYKKTDTIPITSPQGIHLEVDWVALADDVWSNNINDSFALLNYRIEEIICFAHDNSIDLNLDIDSLLSIISSVKRNTDFVNLERTMNLPAAETAGHLWKKPRFLNGIAAESRDIDPFQIKQNIYTYNLKLAKGYEKMNFLSVLNHCFLGEIALLLAKTDPYYNSWYCTKCKEIKYHKKATCNCSKCSTKLEEKSVHVIIFKVSGDLFLKYIGDSSKPGKRQDKASNSVIYHDAPRGKVTIHTIEVVADDSWAQDTFEKHMLLYSSFNMCPIICCDNESEVNPVQQHFRKRNQPAVIVRIETGIAIPIIQCDDQDICIITVDSTFSIELIETLALKRAFKIN